MRLNNLQRLMLGWDELHPYNALDLVEVRRAVTADDVRRAAEQERQLHGLGPAQIDVRTGVCVLQPDAGSVTVDTVEPLPDETPQRTLERHITFELNRRFHQGQVVPFRLAVIPCRPYPFVGFTYHHWLCDGLTGGYLFRRILARLLGIPLDQEPIWSFAGSPDDCTLFPRVRLWPPDLALAWEFLREGLNASAIHVPERPGPFDPTADVHLLIPDLDALPRLRKIARATGGTVNDVLMAVLARALDAVLPERLGRRWRRTLTLGNIANMRPLAASAVQNRGGNHIGFFLIHCRAELPRDLGDLVRLIRRQSTSIKKGSLHLGSILSFRFARLIWPWLPLNWRGGLLRSGLRMTAGISNLAYPADWYGPAWSELLGTYWRGIPTGYTMPLGFGITTVREALTIQLTAHRSAYDEGQIQAIRRLVEVGLREL